MPTKSLTQKLASLQDKKAALDAQIKKIEAEQAQQLRKEKHERARIIGIAMLRLVDDGAWSDEQLMELVSPFIVSGKERRFLGLESTSTSASTKKAPAKSSKGSKKVDSVAPTETADKGSSSRKSSPKATIKPLPEPVGEDDLSNEFNL